MTASQSNLYDILFERKDKAMNLIKMMELGFLPSVASPGEVKKITDLHSEEFLYLFGMAAKSTNLGVYSGAFSTALIDFGGGPVECVIKVGISMYSDDKAFDCLSYCKEKGGKDYCTAFPDVYYLNTIKTRDKDVKIAVLEYVTVDPQSSRASAASYYLVKLVDDYYDRWGLNWKDDQHVSAETDSINNRLEAWTKSVLSKLRWRPEDLARFVAALGAVGGTVDIKGDNLGFRADGSVCAFDPLGV